MNPQLVLGALPLFLVAVCPLSMLLMGGMMSGIGNQDNQQAKLAQHVEHLQVDEGSTASNKTLEEIEWIARVAAK